MKYQKCKKGTRKNKTDDCVDASGNIIVRREDRVVETRKRKETLSKSKSKSIVEEPLPQEPQEPLPQEPLPPEPQGFTESEGRSKSAIFGRDEVSYENKEPLPMEPLPLEHITKKNKKTGMNAFLAEKERLEHKASNETSHDFLYPTLDDPLFNIKIAKKKEFQETKFDATIYDIAKQSNAMCESKFELMPHQLFVKNFLSTQTPYNSLLLYHGLGTGKTCSAIGVAEEMRRYMAQVGIRDKILVVASPNVQGNFRAQLFDESKLVQVPNPANPEEYTWNMESCVGDSLLQEIDPNSVRNIPREKIVSNINAIISTWYEFMGYGQLANYIINKTKVSEESGFTQAERRAMEVKKIRAIFNHKCIIIDEVHNISQTEDGKHKTTGALLMQVAKYATNMRLLLLSATPMFDSYKEIIWLTNLMNAVDKRSLIDVGDVFDALGNFRADVGKDLLIRKLTGYVSYVRGENPYTFPFRVYPDVFAKDRTFSGGGIPYPEIQVNDKPVPAPLAHIKAYLNTIVSDSYQMKAYKYIVGSIKNTYGELNNFDILQKPMECLNIVYPHHEFESAIEKGGSVSSGLATVAIGENGLNNIMTHQDKGGAKNQFEYKSGVVEKYGRVFSQEVLPKYSQKIANLCRIIQQSEGIILVYSQYIDGGVVPIALALEEMGFAKYQSASSAKSLFKKPPREPLDATTMLPKSSVPESDFRQASYIMITGDKLYSPNNSADIAYAKKKENKDGSRVKVILISKAGSEGLDFKHIRQIHIVEPWFNMNRIEQIIGRGVRNLSHCGLPFEQRNVQIYLHGTLLEGEKEEAVDLYVYRIAERKALQIGKVSRVLKQIATDCILNVGQTNMTAEKLMTIASNQQVQIRLSTKETVPFRVGDQPFTDICDYMETCDYACTPTKDIGESDIVSATYSEKFIQSNVYAISKRIRDLFRESHVYKRDTLLRAIQIRKPFPVEHIYYTLSMFIENTHDLLVDKYGRSGYLVNRGEYYTFQPIEINDDTASVFERSVPVNYKRDRLILETPAPGFHGFTDEIVKYSGRAAEGVRGNSGERSSSEFEHAVIGRENAQDNPDVIQRESVDVPAEPPAENVADIIQTVISQYTITEKPRDTKGLDKNWYKNCSNVLDILRTQYDISNNLLSKYIISHSLDEMPYTHKVALLRHFSTTSPGNVHETRIAEYFDEKRMKNPAKNRMGILLANNDEVVLLGRSLDNTAPEWVISDESDLTYFKDELTKHTVSKSRLNRIVGYIVNFKDKEMVFKFKDITLTRNKLGARCDSAGKADVLKMLNTVVEAETYTQENTAVVYQPRLCVLLEILLREYTRVAKNGRVYFLTPEQSILSEITRYTTTNA